MNCFVILSFISLQTTGAVKFKFVDLEIEHYHCGALFIVIITPFLSLNFANGLKKHVGKIALKISLIK